MNAEMFAAAAAAAVANASSSASTSDPFQVSHTVLHKLLVSCELKHYLVYLLFLGKLNQFAKIK